MSQGMFESGGFGGSDATNVSIGVIAVLCFQCLNKKSDLEWVP